MSHPATDIAAKLKESLNAIGDAKVSVYLTQFRIAQLTAIKADVTPDRFAVFLSPSDLTRRILDRSLKQHNFPTVTVTIIGNITRPEALDDEAETKTYFDFVQLTHERIINQHPLQLTSPDRTASLQQDTPETQLNELLAEATLRGSQLDYSFDTIS